MNKVKKLKLINFLVTYLDSNKKESKDFLGYLSQSINLDESDEYFDSVLETLGNILRENTISRLSQAINNFISLYAVLIDKLKSAKESFPVEFQLVDEKTLMTIKLDNSLISDRLLLQDEHMCEEIVKTINKRVNKIRRVNFSGSISLDNEVLLQFVESFIKLFYTRILIIDALINNGDFTDFDLIISKKELKIIDDLIQNIIGMIAKRNIRLENIIKVFNLSDSFNDKKFYLKGGKL